VVGLLRRAGGQRCGQAVGEEVNVASCVPSVGQVPRGVGFFSSTVAPMSKRRKKRLGLL